MTTIRPTTDGSDAQDMIEACLCFKLVTNNSGTDFNTKLNILNTKEVAYFIAFTVCLLLGFIRKTLYRITYLYCAQKF